jgi:Bacteriophage holin of superfamily 6 (Holin_LLH)
MWQKLLVQVLLALIPVLGDLIIAFIQNLQKWLTNPDDTRDISGVIWELVVGEEKNNPDLDGDVKWQRVYEAAVIYVESKGLEVSKSLINTMIELAVQKYKAQQVQTS